MVEVDGSLLNVEETMNVLNASRSEVFRKAKDGAIRVHKRENTILFSEEEVRELASSEKTVREEFRNIARRLFSV